MVHAIGKDNDCFAALLFAHHFIGGEEYGIVEQRAAAVAVPATISLTATVPPASAAVSISTSGSPVRGRLRDRQGLECRLQLWARVGEVLKQLDFAIKIEYGGQVLVFAEQMIDEAVTGFAFLIEDTALAEAGIHEETETQRQITF